jgi:hypothetical protein
VRVTRIRNETRRQSDPIQNPNVVSEMKALRIMESGSRNKRDTNVIRTEVDRQLLDDVTITKQ